MNYIPGARNGGIIESKVLENWITKARTLANAEHIEDIADYWIGKMLSASPMAGDGVCTIKPKSNMIDLFHSNAMIEGFKIGKSNRRGVTTRMTSDGGALECEEEMKYRAWIGRFRVPSVVTKLRSRVRDSMRMIGQA
ncbi:hypothetical protein K1Y77_16205 [Halomonas qaidamensis]|uniref:HK97 gp10 family phage protein n=1 Tax=Halomonas qaidamensis TaxID=2866211 RepID=A0ABY6JP58_9GAMM|nr:hypothetical protein [Halomonas qaidamensis]UYV18965.1 hypothetical protein K1Y77_16205 [Halomonas qaidamensis]